MKKKALFAFSGLMLTFALVACNGDEESNETVDEAASGGSDTDAETDTEASAATSGTVTLAGSSAMQPLIGAAAEIYMEEVNTEADIQVQAGGSGAGLSQVSQGQVDIGNSDLFAEEEDNIPHEDLVDHRVAVVGMGAVANPGVGVDDLTQDELIDVWTGEVTNWSEVGGEDVDITLVNRPDSSGTRATFVDYALEGAEPAEGITEDSSNTVRQIVADTEGAIGYLAFSHIDDSVAALSIDGVEPSAENVQAGEFPIWAYQHSYTNGEPDGLVKEFLDYLLSEEIQSTLIPEQGYISVTEMQVERDAEGNETPVE
ncbi:phosphate ABC transporter substrate-binding protein [Geomicrobium sp. JCM 19038]|uniref:phosphate ABC transporter substrate-binding protein n=1 Tax=Geomicrobium sp. JCM 19038 TaxID=1460635 RepID=UPI00045F1C0F|nr:phosphate ABC transporter substrate-binding protein [Geomicrobium sp. JCM 19038]GAK09291.1 phosphate ABC transporter, periplasmic phosphate-binding protein PstS [Geomicrobium sp. JCM 19038]